MDDRPVAGESPQRPAASARPERRRSRATVLSVLGELLITVGVVVLLFIGWQLWWNDMIVGSAQTTAAHQLSDKWDDIEATPLPTPTASAAPGAIDYGEPPVLAGPEDDGTIANLYIPRYGDFGDTRLAREGAVTAAADVEIGRASCRERVWTVV